MNKEYCKEEWWLRQIKTKCETKQKESENYIKSNNRFKILLLFSFIVLTFGIVVGIITDLQTTNFAKSIGESIKTLLMFIAGILAGFTIDEYRNKSIILENASLLRPLIFEEIIKEIGQKGIIQTSQIQKCISHIQNGASQMSKSGGEGFAALKEVVNNVIKEICT